MASIPKPELERGNYICYADEPNTIVDNAGGGGEGGGGGGGGVVFLPATYNAETDLVTVDFTYNDVAGYIADNKLPVLSDNLGNVFCILNYSFSEIDSQYVVSFLYPFNNVFKLTFVANEATSVMAQIPPLPLPTP